MWATLALATALNLAPSQSDALQLKNVRTAYSLYGPERKDSRLLGGDVYYVLFDIVGLKVRDDGRVQYSIAMDVTGKDGKSLFKQDPRDLETFVTLGGDRVPADASVFLGTDVPPGEYTIKVTVKESGTEKSDTLTRKFEILPKQFGLVQTGFSYPLTSPQAAPLPAPPAAVPGQTLILNFSVVGFDLDKNRKDQPDVEATLRVLDEEGKPTIGKPYAVEVKEVAPGQKTGFPGQFVLQINRAGKFKAELKATDKLSGKSAGQTFDLNVIELK